MASRALLFAKVGSTTNHFLPLFLIGDRIDLAIVTTLFLVMIADCAGTTIVPTIVPTIVKKGLIPIKVLVEFVVFCGAPTQWQLAALTGGIALGW